MIYNIMLIEILIDLLFMFKKYIKKKREEERDMKNVLSDIRYEKCAVLSTRCYVDKLYNVRN